MKIGLITLFRNHNYGSVLQCYALQSVLEDYGCEVEVLSQNEKGLYWKLRSLNIKLRFLISCLFYPERWHNYKKFLLESKRSSETISSEVKFAFDSFLQRNIKSRRISYKELCKDNEYNMFISGSDQVWSVSAPMLNPFMFLRFTSKNKRASYAASTGSHIIPPWYKRKLKRYINDFRYLSLRESLVVTSLKDIGCRNLNQHIDPSLLKPADFWITHSSKCEDIKEDRYILLFFLNKPSQMAIQHIQHVISDLNLPIYSFPYNFEELDIISKDIRSVNVRPEEFVQVFNNAAVICTDSFHGVAFSINLRKEFFVYGREYSTGTNQGSRIDSILNRYGLENRYIKDYNQITYPIPNYEAKLEKDRIRSLEYIKMIIE